MTPEQKEILALNQELGRAEGIIKGLLETERNLTEHTISVLMDWLDETEKRESFLP